MLIKDTYSITRNNNVIIGFDSRKLSEKTLLIKEGKSPYPKINVKKVGINEKNISEIINIIIETQSHFFCNLLIFKFYSLLNFLANNKTIITPNRNIMIIL